MLDWLKKLLGNSNDAEVKKLDKIVDQVEALEDSYKQLTDAQLRAKTDEFRNRLQNGETEDDILPEAFATVREAAWRVLGMRPYRVQVMGGLTLHQGRIAEMKTGEGKTLTAAIAAYLNALPGKGGADFGQQTVLCFYVAMFIVIAICCICAKPYYSSKCFWTGAIYCILYSVLLFVFWICSLIFRWEISSINWLHWLCIIVPPIISGLYVYAALVKE